MSNGLFRNLIIARAMSVEPVARALCTDPLDFEAGPFARPDGRWHSAAVHAARGSAVSDVDEDQATPHAFARR